MSQREIAEALGISLGAVNKAMQELTEKGCCEKGVILQAGLDALEPYRVKRAVFIAAGFGSRMVPITFNTPKPLVRVNGTRIIDTLLDAVAAAGIPEIVIVRGYLGEQFDQLLYKYPNIRFVENPVYNEANNISSAVCVRYLLQNAYVLEADLFLRNKHLIRKMCIRDRSVRPRPPLSACRNPRRAAPPPAKTPDTSAAPPPRPAPAAQAPAPAARSPPAAAAGSPAARRV